MWRLSVAVFAVVWALFGCSHALEVKNRSEFLVDATYVKNPPSTGVMTTNNLDNGKLLVDATVEALRSRTGKPVIYPYRQDQGAVDLLVQMTIESKHQGSGTNFLINWPGFLIWAPAWNGYIYKPHYTVKVVFVDPASSATRDSFEVPIDLDVRHADINRTWTEISWFEVSLIALIGGFNFTSYDDKVTPLLEREMQRELGTYLAEKILQRVKELEAKSLPAT